MHVHQSIWKDGKPLFAGSGYADLSETALYYIGGIIKHAKALNAFTQPEHQLLQAPHPGLRGAGAAGLLGAQPLGLVPHPVRVAAQGQARRGALPRSVGQPVPRLRGDADGRPRRHPEQDPSGRPDGQEPVRPAAGRAREGPDRRAARCARRSNCLDADRAFLTKGGVFTDDQIDAYIELKWEEVYAWEHQPAPIEYKMYYSI